MKNTSSRRHILNITFVALFAAVAYISLMLFFFPVGPMYIHFGNLVVVVAALLVGGWQGGLAGAVGMGLYDLFNGHADSVPKTLILKFLIGLTVGLVFNFLNNRKKYPFKILLGSGMVSLLISLIVLYLGVVGNTLSLWTIGISVILAVIGILGFILAFLKTKVSQNTASAFAGAACGMLVNILGEFLWKTVVFILAGSSWTAACVASATAQSSTLINAVISVIGGVALFGALKKPFEKILGK